MSFAQKYIQAQIELEHCRIDSIVQLKWLDTLLHRFGLPIRPLHYRTGIQLFVQQAIIFGTIVSLANILWLYHLLDFMLPVPFLPLIFVSYGLLYSIIFCAQVEIERDACQLSQWDDL